MPEQITISVNGKSVAVDSGTTVAAAMLMTGTHCRKSVSGEPRGPLCGMGSVLNAELGLMADHISGRAKYCVSPECK